MKSTFCLSRPGGKDSLGGMCVCVDPLDWGVWILRICSDPPHPVPLRYPSGSYFLSRPYHPPVLRGAVQMRRKATAAGTGQTDRWICLARHGASKRVDSEGNSLLRLMMAFFSSAPSLSHTSVRREPMRGQNGKGHFWTGGISEGDAVGRGGRE